MSGEKPSSWRTWLKSSPVSSPRQGHSRTPSLVEHSDGNSASRADEAKQVVKRGSVASLASAYEQGGSPNNNDEVAALGDALNVALMAVAGGDAASTRYDGADSSIVLIERACKRQAELGQELQEGKIMVSQFVQSMQEEVRGLKSAADDWLAAVAAGSVDAVDDVVNQISAVESMEQAMEGVCDIAGTANSVVQEYRDAMEPSGDTARRPRLLTIEHDINEPVSPVDSEHGLEISREAAVEMAMEDAEATQAAFNASRQATVAAEAARGLAEEAMATVLTAAMAQLESLRARPQGLEGEAKGTGAGAGVGESDASKNRSNQGSGRSFWSSLMGRRSQGAAEGSGSGPGSGSGSGSGHESEHHLAGANDQAVRRLSRKDSLATLNPEESRSRSSSRSDGSSSSSSSSSGSSGAEGNKREQQEEQKEKEKAQQLNLSSLTLDSDSSGDEAEGDGGDEEGKGGSGGASADWAGLLSSPRSTGSAEAAAAAADVPTPSPAQLGHRIQDSASDFKVADFYAPPRYLQPYAYKELRAATDHFAVDSILGCGGFATVFSGKLGQTKIAVKLMGARVDFKAAGAGAGVDAGADIAGKDAHLAPVPMNPAMVHEQCVAEAAALRGWNHPRVVRLLGTCRDDGPYRCLVFELMDGGCLLDRLKACRVDCPAAGYKARATPTPEQQSASDASSGDASATSRALSWQVRVQIAVDVAEALAFLHTRPHFDERTTNALSLPLIHRDVKSANVLLTSDGRARLADFGTAKSFRPPKRCRSRSSSSSSSNSSSSKGSAAAPGQAGQEQLGKERAAGGAEEGGDGGEGEGAGGGGKQEEEEQDHMSTLMILGTRSYMPLEYIQDGQLSPKLDAYSLGVILLELLTALGAYDQNRSPKTLRSFMWRRLPTIAAPAPAPAAAAAAAPAADSNRSRSRASSKSAKSTKPKRPTHARSRSAGDPTAAQKAQMSGPVQLSREFVEVVDPVARWEEAPAVEVEFAKIARLLLVNEPWLRPTVDSILPKLREVLEVASGGSVPPLLRDMNISFADL